ncbi:unnamed protein product [Diamesa tonsa]
MASLMNCETDVRVKNIFDIYPEELLLKIFGFLDSASVKSVALVNKRCHDIVTIETVTMKNLPLMIYDDILRKKHLIVGNLNFKFYKVFFDSIFKTFNMNMLACMKKIGLNFREIEFMLSSVSDPKVFKNILINFPNAEKLTFNGCSFRKHNKNLSAQVLELVNLNELVMKQSCLKVFDVFQAQLKSLKVETTTGNTNEVHLMEFLYTQKRLETLALRNINRSSVVFAKNQGAKYQFKLKELSLRKIRFENQFEDENLKDFLDTQKDSIEILELGRTFSNDVYVLVLNKFLKVKTLRIDIAVFPDDLNFYKRIKVNKNVTKLMIYGELEDTVRYCTILRLFPNVTDIRFSSQISCEVLTCLPKCCNALMSLSLDSLRPGNYKNLKFPALKNLHFDWLANQSEWMNFVMANTTVESLSFKWIFEQLNMNPLQLFGKALKMVCSVLPNLKHLKLGGYMKDNMHYLQDIVGMCTNLESMDVLEDDIDIGMMPMRSGFKFRCYDRSSIMYVFPTHETIWKNDIGDHDSEDVELVRAHDYNERFLANPSDSETDDNDEDTDDDNNNYIDYFNHDHEY